MSKLATFLVFIAILLVACGGDDNDSASETKPAVEDATFTPPPGATAVAVDLPSTSAESDVQGLPSLPYAERVSASLYPAPRDVKDFSLPASVGEFTLSDFRGKYTLLYFGYTFCPDICPLTLADVNQAYRSLGEPTDKVTFVFITVDPERDTLDRLTTYAQAFHPDFIAARADNLALLQPVMDDFGVVAIREEVEESAAAYLVSHTGSVFIVDPAGRLVGRFVTATPASSMARDLAVLFEYLPESAPENNYLVG